jgi:ribonuclease VapC
LIVVDSSALIAIHLGEPQAEDYSDLIAQDGAPHISTLTLFETRTVLSFRGGMTKIREFEAWLRVARAIAVVFDEHQSTMAFEAYQRWGKGNHPAALNLGGCAAYALATSLDAPLLFKGEDFARTDVRRAL